VRVVLDVAQRRVRLVFLHAFEGAGADGHAVRRRLEAGHHRTESNQLATHVDALKAAGFSEVGTLWQRGGNRLPCGVLWN
jgi:hypothetical protein